MSSDSQQLIVIAATVVLAGLWIGLRVLKFIRRRRPPRIHPQLAKYQYGEGISELRGAEAEKIIATSSTHEIAGYRVLRQIEAVFVDGFRRPEEAIKGLKAASAMKGANAVLNVRHNASSMGRYSAAGDAVIVETPEQSSDASTRPPKPTTGNSGQMDQTGER